MNFALVKIDMWKGEGNCLSQRHALSWRQLQVARDFPVPMARMSLIFDGDQVVGLEKPVNTGFRREVARLVGKPDSQFPRRQFGLLQRHLDDLVMDVRRDAVPHPARR